MAASPARATPGSDLIRWMQQFEAHIASQQVRGRLGSITGSPRVKTLRQLQNSAQRLLRALSTSFWAQDAGTRQVVQSAYLSALVTVKLFADDVYIETIEEARQPKGALSLIHI